MSISPPVSTTALMGESRSRPGAGQSRSFARICCRRSGDALIMTQLLPSAVTAMDAWVRMGADCSPARAARLTAPLQFHCGTPPPAADPRTRICKAMGLAGYLARGATSGEATLFSASVGVDLKTDGDHTNTGSGPLFHEILLTARSHSCRASTSAVGDDRAQIVIFLMWLGKVTVRATKIS